MLEMDHLYSPYCPVEVLAPMTSADSPSCGLSHEKVGFSPAPIGAGANKPTQAVVNVIGAVATSSKLKFCGIYASIRAHTDVHRPPRGTHAKYKRCG
jgi:hypothetical protein